MTNKPLDYYTQLAREARALREREVNAQIDRIMKRRHDAEGKDSFAWVERYDVLLAWLVIAAMILALSWMGLLQ